MRQLQPLEIDKAQVLGVAMHDFGEYGFAYASLRRICEMGGFTPARLRRAFRSKEELYVACVEAAYTQLSAYLWEFQVEAEVGLEVNLLRLYRTWLYFFRAHPAQVRVMIGARAVPPPGLQTKLSAIRKTLLSACLQEILEEIARAYLPNDAKQQAALAQLWASMLDSVIIGSGLQKHDFYPENLEVLLHAREEMFKKALHIWVLGMEAEKTAQ